jgi:outer membrane protein assembly factor BamB
MRDNKVIRRILAIATGFTVLSAPFVVAAPPPERKTPSATDWPIFLGPLGTGVTSDAGISQHWPPSGPPIVWSKRIGAGYSSPSIRGGKLVIHHRLRNTEVVECVRAETGEPIWKIDYPSDFRDPYGYNNGPRCTPLLTRDRCYTFGAEGRLLCVELASGKKIWERDIPKDFYVPPHFFGVGCTPILEGDLLIVLIGGQPNSGVVAFRADSGATVWQSVGKETWDGIKTDWPTEPVYRWTGNEMVVSYSSPIAATIHGQRHVLCLMRQGLVSVDPRNGHVNFKYWFCSRDYESVTAARPVVIGDRIFISAAYKVGSALLQVEPSGRGVKELWRNRTNLLAHWSTPIEVAGFVYGFSGRHEPEGELRCVDLATGNVVWQTRGYDGDVEKLAADPATGQIVDQVTKKPIPFPFFGRGSLTKVGDRFLVLGERGTLALAELSPKGYHELGRTSFKDIEYPVWPSPVVVGTQLYLRDENTLLCVDLSAKP